MLIIRPKVQQRLQSRPINVDLVAKSGTKVGTWSIWTVGYLRKSEVEKPSNEHNLTLPLVG